DEWPTFGGDPSRQRPLPAESADPNRLVRLCREGPAWRFRLYPMNEPARPGKPAEFVPAAQRARVLAFHPIIVGNHVLVADARGGTAYAVPRGGAQAWAPARDGKVRVNQQPNGLTLRTALPAPADVRYTLTAADGRVYAR